MHTRANFLDAFSFSQSSLLLLQEDQFADAKKRMGWEVPTEERPWDTFGENGTSPSRKKKSFL